MIDLGVLAERRSITVSHLKRRAEEIHHEVGDEGRVYALRYGEHEDMAVVSLRDLVQLARDNAELIETVRSLERELATVIGVPLLGGPDEDDLIRCRLAEPRVSGDLILDDLRARLGRV